MHALIFRKVIALLCQATGGVGSPFDIFENFLLSFVHWFELSLQGVAESNRDFRASVLKPALRRRQSHLCGDLELRNISAATNQPRILTIAIMVSGRAYTYQRTSAGEPKR